MRFCRGVKSPNAIWRTASRSPRWAVSTRRFHLYHVLRDPQGLGVHILREATNLDTWFPEQVEFMTKMGNKKANDYWEASSPSFEAQESDRMGLESYIKAKYTRSKYASKSDVAPTYDNVVAGKVSWRKSPPRRHSQPSLRACRPSRQKFPRRLSRWRPPLQRRRLGGLSFGRAGFQVEPAACAGPSRWPSQRRLRPLPLLPCPCRRGSVDPFAVSTGARAAAAPTRGRGSACGSFCCERGTRASDVNRRPSRPASDPFAGGTGLDLHCFQDAVVQRQGHHQGCNG